MFIRFSRTLTCDRQRDRQTDGQIHDTAHTALAWRRAVKTQTNSGENRTEGKIGRRPSYSAYTGDDRSRSHTGLTFTQTITRGYCMKVSPELATVSSRP